jgi:hypothetical protein
MPPAGFEITIPANKQPQTHAYDRAATGIGDDDYKHKIIIILLVVKRDTLQSFYPEGY